MKSILFILLITSALIKTNAQTKCIEAPFRPIDYIQNPSFETTGAPISNGCPTGFPYPSLGVYVPYWFVPTKIDPVAYLNACSNFIIPDSVFRSKDFLNNYGITNRDLPTATQTNYAIVPQPIPDGSGVIGLIDYNFGSVANEPSVGKSYVATILTKPLLKDSLYKLSFYLGFGKKSPYRFVEEDFSPGYLELTEEFSSTPEEISVFGLSDSYAAPVSYGCPVYNGWDLLATVKVSSKKKGIWIQDSLLFVAHKNIRSIAIGPSCDSTASYYSSKDTDTSNGLGIKGPYYGDTYFLDKLQLYQSSVSVPKIAVSAGSFCNGSVVLTVQPEEYKTSRLEWFKNGALLTGENNISLSVSRTQYGQGYYQCLVQSDTVCLLSDSFRVVWQATPSAAILGVNNDTTVCNGDTLLLNAYTDSATTYLWQNGSVSPTMRITKPGFYNVTITNTCGTAYATKNVTYQPCDYNVYIPTAFTPNNDGLNDVFKANYFHAPANFRMRIYSRYGNVVFESNNSSKGWDGNFKSQPMPIGVYIWIVEYNDHEGKFHSLKGLVILMR